MGMRKFKPTNNGLRERTVSDFADITADKPYKPLTKVLKANAGRNNQGTITVRHREGGNRKFYRVVDFKRTKIGIPAIVKTVEYDPNRNCRIALIAYRDGEKSYIVAPLDLHVGDSIMNGPTAEIKTGNHLPLRNIPAGTMLYNLELTKGRGGQIARSAGMFVKLLAKDGDYAAVKMPSGEQRLVHLSCGASIGQVGNIDAYNLRLGKAGRSRHLGVRPRVRGTAMNPVDHPHGGGEGRAPVGRINPRTLWGKVAFGVKTRDPKKTSNALIIKSRKRKASMV